MKLTKKIKKYFEQSFDSANSRHGSSARMSRGFSKILTEKVNLSKNAYIMSLTEALDITEPITWLREKCNESIWS